MLGVLGICMIWLKISCLIILVGILLCVSSLFIIIFFKLIVGMLWKVVVWWVKGVCKLLIMVIWLFWWVISGKIWFIIFFCKKINKVVWFDYSFNYFFIFS